MKILYLNSTPINTEKANLIQVKAMCKAMASLGYDVTLSLPGKKPSNLDSFNYKIIFRKQWAKNKLDKYLSIIPLLKSIKQTNPDILFIRDPQILLYAYLFSRKKIIFETHNNNLHQGYKVLDKFYHLVLKKVVSNGQVKKLVCISHALANYWKKQGISDYNIVVAHDGIDIEMFDIAKTKTRVREELSLPKDKIIATYSGRLYANRKIDNVLTLASKFPETFFLVVGGPNLNAQFLKSEADRMQLKNILFTGQVNHDQVPSYLAASDILLALWSSDVPTINYCSPLKLFEYMAAEKIIVAHGFPTIKEVLTHKVNSLLVNIDDTDDLIKKLKMALELPNNTNLPTNAYKEVSKNYTWKKRVSSIFVSFSK